MPYEIEATSLTPALIIYLLDVSGSMRSPLGARRRIDVVYDALTAAITEMIYRSDKGGILAARYRVAMYAYSRDVYDLIGGVKTIDQVARLGNPPSLKPLETTDTAKGFAHVERLLERELPKMREHPAPLVCHITDGEYTEDDPEPVVKRIMQMRNSDGNVLVENIFVSDAILPDPIPDLRQWKGITPRTRFSTGKIGAYAQKLRSISSVVPESYRLMMREFGYDLAAGSYLMFAGMTPELVEMAFLMSTNTYISEGVTPVWEE